MASSFKLTFNRIGDQQNLLLCFSSLRQESLIRDLLRIVNNDGHKIGEPAEADSMHVHRFYDAAFAIREITSSFGFTVITKKHAMPHGTSGHDQHLSCGTASKYFIDR